MSEALDKPRQWRFYVADMTECARKVISYTRGLKNQAAFVRDSRTYDAALRNLELIGEAATHIPQNVREAYPEIAWREIVALRNRLIHAYLGIDDDVLWDIIQTDVPELFSQLRRLMEQDQRG